MLERPVSCLERGRMRRCVCWCDGADEGSSVTGKFVSFAARLGEEAAFVQEHLSP